MDWHLFKSGLILPEIEGKSVSECVKEGLRLISDSLYRRQSIKLNSLKQVASKEAEGDSENKDSIISAKVPSLVRKKTTMLKLESLVEEFESREVVWLPQV